MSNYCALALFVVLFELLICCHGDNGNGFVEPHDYTISFFQFNPKDIGVGNSPKKQSKKEIKNSDILPNNKKDEKQNKISDIEKGNLTQVNTTFNGTSDLEKVKEWKDITNASRIVISHRSNITDGTNETLNSNNTFSNNNTTDVKNITKSANETQQLTKPTASNTTQRSFIAHNKNHAKKKDHLNPNPQPSLHEAEMNLKAPTHQVNVIKQEKPTAPINLYTKNTTKVEQTKASNSEVKTSENLQKTGGKNVTSEKDEKLAKLEKDKKRNEEILRNAKKIRPVPNMVDTKFNNHSIHPVLPPAKSLNNTPPQNFVIQRSKVQNTNGNKKPTDSNVHSHREKAKSLLPNFAQAHQENFQLGSLKHPRHDLYPTCHQCLKNSTYKSCVRKSNLKTCNHDLQNICYSKSLKKGKSISYEMGCTDHKACKSAKAYPCKDGSSECFFCCQFNQCNSSPHHGNFELDEINLDELKLDTDSEKEKGDKKSSKGHISKAPGMTELIIFQVLLGMILAFI